MKTLCILDSISRANGGIFEAERRLQQTLQASLGVNVRVVGLRDAFTDADLPAWSPLVPQVFATRGPRAFGYAPGLAAALLRSQADLAYVAGLWKYPSVAAWQWARQSGRPMMVAPHGMLDAWALRNSRMKKRLVGWLFQNAHLRQAACLRALCNAELESIRAYGLKNPVAVIPNGIDVPTSPAIPNAAVPQLASLSDRKVLLYVGRLHPKKGLANLITAWRRVSGAACRDWVLALAGWDQGNHEAELKRQATELGIPWGDAALESSKRPSIVFLGPTFGSAKAALYSRCEAFILPSLSEGLPMAVLEAWAYGKPVLLTPECNLPEGFAAHAALRIHPTSESLADVLGRLFEMSSEERRTMGDKGLALVKARFAWPKIAAEMLAVQQWMLGGGPKPGSVTS
jgi:poly(glycerol-phosphate) alpha-glucosyltransferase